MKILFLFLLMSCSLIPFTSFCQTVLKKTVISNGGELSSNNSYRLNLSIGQSVTAKVMTESSEACIGFWYEVTGITNKPIVLEKFKVSEKVIIRPIERGAELKIYPNPFFDKSQIEFEIVENGKIRLSMFDLQGREIDVLLNEYLTEGKYKLTYQSPSSMNGMYTLFLTTGKERLHQACIILK